MGSSFEITCSPTYFPQEVRIKDETQLEHREMRQTRDRLHSIIVGLAS